MQFTGQHSVPTLLSRDQFRSELLKPFSVLAERRFALPPFGDVRNEGDCDLSFRRLDVTQAHLYRKLDAVLAKSSPINRHLRMQLLFRIFEPFRAPLAIWSSKVFRH